MSRSIRLCAAALCSVLLSMALMSCGGSGGGGAFTSSGSSSTGSSSGSGSGSGSGSTASGSNVAVVTVNSGATGNSVNTLFVSVKVCVPGSTSNCQTIDNIQVDTGSIGLRILSSALSVTLPTQTAKNSSGALLECLNFVDGYIWGPVALADVSVGGESAGSVPVQVIGDSRYPNVPTDCQNAGNNNNEDTVSAFGANGILGVAPEAVYDCTSCVTNPIVAAYYACTSASSCTESEAPLAQQVQSVVALFTTDNNGVIIDLPAVSNPAVGQASVTGQLIFGIDTESNNASGTQTVLTTDEYGDLTIHFNGQTLNGSFIDSGSNGIFVDDSSIPACTQSGITDFYCPTSTLSLTATLIGQNGTQYAASFGIANGYNLLTQNYFALPDLGGTYDGTNTTFDYGLPFFYGRRVAVAMTGITTTAGTGPYLAF